MTARNNKAADAYVALIADIQKKLAILQEAADNHLGADPDNISWPDVGDATHLLKQLSDAADMITKSGEYANS